MNAMSFSDMGLAALKQQQFDAAINMLRQALGEDMDNLAARFGLARALHEKVRSSKQSVNIARCCNLMGVMKTACITLHAPCCKMAMHAVP